MMGMFNETSGLNGGFEVSMWFSLQRFDSLTSESDIFASFIPMKEKKNRVEWGKVYISTRWHVENGFSIGTL